MNTGKKMRHRCKKVLQEYTEKTIKYSGPDATGEHRRDDEVQWERYYCIVLLSTEETIRHRRTDATSEHKRNNETTQEAGATGEHRRDNKTQGDKCYR